MARGAKKKKPEEPAAKRGVGKRGPDRKKRKKRPALKITCGDFGGRNQDGSPCGRKVKGGGLCRSHIPKPPQKTGTKKTGRPLKEISERQLLELAKIDCSYEEMAAVLDCGVSLLKDRFRLVIEKGREGGKASLKRAQWKKAVTDGNPAMLIFLGKNRLGQTDRQFLEHGGEITTKLEEMSDEDLLARAEELTTRLAAGSTLGDKTGNGGNGDS